MKIAVTSANGQTISGHAGKCPGFLIFELSPDQTVHQKHIQLDSTQVLMNLKQSLSNYPNHPLFGIDAFITQSMGKDMEKRLKSDGIKVFKTHLKEPLEVLNSITLTFKQR